MARKGDDRGASLVELLVVLVIVSVLALTALPMAETSVQRRREAALRENLRYVRTAIDRFHADWRANAMAEEAEGVSTNGFPTGLEVLVSGVDAAEDGAPPLKYLRRLPANPFAASDLPPERHWRLIGYAQAPSEPWDQEDVFDIRPTTDKRALDGSDIANW